MEVMSLELDKRERRAKTNHSLCKQLYKELSLGTLDPHQLITPFKFGEAGFVEKESQPFRVVVHPQVALICDIHSHTSEAEVIGFLAGKWDADSHTLFIQAPIPCSSTERIEDNGSTDVELDAEAEFKAMEKVSDMNLKIVGWYHSHPRFKGDPSVIDVSNQRNYQHLFRDEKTGKEPFVGLIISTFDKQLEDGKSSHNWFAVRPYTDDAGTLTSVYMPVQIEVEIQKYQIDSSKTISSDLNEVLLIDLKTSLEEWKSVPSNSSQAPPMELVPAKEKLSKKAIKKEEKSPAISNPPRKSNRKADTSLTPPVTESTKSDKSSVVSDPSPVSPTRRSGRTPKPNTLYWEEPPAEVAEKPPVKVGNGRKKRKADEVQLAAVPPINETTEAVIDSNSTAVSDNKKVTARSQLSMSIYNSFVLSLQETTLQSSELARKIILTTATYLRFAAICLLSIGFHFSRYHRRLELSKPWRGKTKLDKLGISADRWIKYFVDENENVHSSAIEFLANVLDFYKACWEEYSKVSGKIKKAVKGEPGDKAAATSTSSTMPVAEISQEAT
jgi:proteasome lid subunit RPN8/RPN11